MSVVVCSVDSTSPSFDERILRTFVNFSLLEEAAQNPINICLTLGPIRDHIEHVGGVKGKNV